MVNITDEDIWNAEPALRPEDEILLKKLHDMLQSTADDLKLLSGELSKYHEPGVQVKSLPTPLDEDFNEKVHIEELVHAKFHGYDIVNNSQPTIIKAHRDIPVRLNKNKPFDLHKANNVIDAGIQVSPVPMFRKPAKKKNLTVSCTKVIQINENVNNAIRVSEDHNRQQEDKINKPTVAYKELTFKYTEPKIKISSLKPLQVQNMPSINIRAELREQKVLQLNIEPKNLNHEQNDANKNNIGVILVRHESILDPKVITTTNFNDVQCPVIITETNSKEPIRKYSQMSSCESSEVDSHNKVYSLSRSFRKTKPCRATKTVTKQQLDNIKNKRNVGTKNDSAKRTISNLELWKNKLSIIYGCPTSSRRSKLMKPENKPNMPSNAQAIKNSNTLNNVEYIPYSKFTLGGARVSDIEKELSGIPNRNDVTLGPILNKILSRENSFHNESPGVDKGEASPKILTTSDENLLQEVLDIERKVSNTVTKKSHVNKDQAIKSVDDPGSYADDFEDDKSDYSVYSEKQNQISDDGHSNGNNLDKSQNSDSENRSFKSANRLINIHDKTHRKTLKLSLKKHVDVYEFLHNIDTQDTGTQSNTTQKISLKETQTSPRHDKCYMQPILNDLWPPTDPNRELEKLFQLEKDFIKKLIVDEYGDLLEKNLNKPSTSGNQGIDEKNITASQKNTQTSPAHVKCVMTSPTKTKTRTTSPFALSLTVDQQTSPINEDVKINIQDVNELGLCINLSSPRFSLHLPDTSREILCNLESHAPSNQTIFKTDTKGTLLSRKNIITSSSSAEGDYSSSDISSLGEVRFKLKRFRKLQVPILSELSSSTSRSKHCSDFSDGIIPLQSEGEVSLGQVNKRKVNNKKNQSEGETSVGHLY